MVQGGDLTPGQAALGFFAALALAEVFGPLRRGVADLGRMMDAARRVGRQLDHADTTQPPARNDNPVSTGQLTLQNVAWREDPSSEAVVSGISFSLSPGNIIALTGPSGCGKSTILHLAAGLLSPGEGRVTLDGRDMGDWSEAELRARIGFLPQRSVLTRAPSPISCAWPGPAPVRRTARGARGRGALAGPRPTRRIAGGVERNRHRPVGGRDPPPCPGAGPSAPSCTPSAGRTDNRTRPRNSARRPVRSTQDLPGQYDPACLAQPG